jgi:hypothetical protein
VSRFKGGGINLSPLKLQLTTDGSSATLCEWRASFQGEVSAAHSRPQVSRPSVLGTTIVKAASVPIDTVGTSTSYVISQFDTQPSLPAAATMTYAMRSFISYQYQTTEKSGLVVYDGGGLLLYALAGAGGAWDGDLVWEER